MHVYLNSPILNFIIFYVLSSRVIESCSCQGQFINVRVIQTDQVTSLTEVLKSRSDGVGSFSQSRTNVHFLASLSLSLKFKHLFTGNWFKMLEIVHRWIQRIFETQKLLSKVLDTGWLINFVESLQLSCSNMLKLKLEMSNPNTNSS